jgi:antitoxin (DNA-binding transcriptional repressor) of toxin-antitoxin stability system
MRQIGIREFKSNASAWLRRVREGEEMTVTGPRPANRASFASR